MLLRLPGGFAWPQMLRANQSMVAGKAMRPNMAGAKGPARALAAGAAATAAAAAAAAAAAFQGAEPVRQLQRPSTCARPFLHCGRAPTHTQILRRGLQDNVLWGPASG